MGRPKIINTDVCDQTCSYNCGRAAIVQFQNKRFCCSENLSACPAQKKKNALKQLGNKNKLGKTQDAWNRGLTKLTYPSLARPKQVGVKFGLSLTGHTNETKDKLRKAAKKNKLGGHTSKKQIYFKKKDGEVVWLQSSYEIRFAELLEELNIKWSRPSPLNWVDDNGIEHRYYPDFKIGLIFIDTKNDYLAKKDARKIELVRQLNNIDLRVVLKNQITKEYIAGLPKWSTGLAL